jgi:enoyl-CoA hydratase/carnithine racemase
VSISGPELVVSNPAAGVTEILLNRPHKGNALNADIVEALHDAVDRAVETRLLIVRGAGNHFCTGFDLSDLDDSTDSSLLYRFVRIELLLHKIFAAPFVTMALAAGRVTGAGADLFAACDRRIAVRDATMSFPGAGFGLILGTERLAHRIGLDKTRDILRSGRALNGQDALAAGLATELIAQQEIEAVVARELTNAIRLDATTVKALHQIGIDDGSRQLAALVRSAAQPGLKERMVAYRRSMQRQPR